MPSDVVQVPVALLLSPALSALAKLVWMIARLRSAAATAGPAQSVRPATATAGPAQSVRPATASAGTARSATAAAVSRPTMLKGMAQLAAAGWDPANPDDRGVTVPVPAALLTNRRLGIEARVLYGILLLTPGFKDSCGRFTYAGLAHLAQASRNTVATALRELAGAEWLTLSRDHRKAPIHFQLTSPGFDRAITAVAGAQKRLERANFFGEQLMREYLSLLVDSTDFEDDAAPGFLVNPRTDERLQLDRFYPPSVAWEFNGPQHYRATEMYSTEDVARQQERDYIKLGICVTRGITLVVVQPEDLTLARMRAKIGNLLPMRDWTGSEILLEYLETESKSYQRRMARLFGEK